jgi:hypothetical protein
VRIETGCQSLAKWAAADYTATLKVFSFPSAFSAPPRETGEGFLVEVQRTQRQKTRIAILIGSD